MIKLPFIVEPYPLGVISTGNERTAHPATHLGLFKYIAMTWRTLGSNNVWLEGNFQGERAIDFLSVLAANALPTTKMRVMLSDVGGTIYDSGALPFISPAIVRDDGLYHSHLELPEIVNARYWRIEITDHTGDFQAAKVVFGKRVTPGRFYDSTFEFGVKDLGSIEYGRWGVPSEEGGLILRTLSFRLPWIRGDEYEGNWRPLVERVGIRKPIMICFDPEPGPYRQTKTYFGTLKEAPFSKGGAKPGTYSMEYAMLSYI